MLISPLLRLGVECFGDILHITQYKNKIYIYRWAIKNDVSVFFPRMSESSFNICNTKRLFFLPSAPPPARPRRESGAAVLAGAQALIWRVVRLAGFASTNTSCRQCIVLSFGFASRLFNIVWIVRYVPPIYSIGRWTTSRGMLWIITSATSAMWASKVNKLSCPYDRG